ncbi:hypothetical protein PR048_007601 [Dryococelus australis]|uniref:Uncharacterized protein n=1 Tax=Dryococelus australis TaxID=614101 RepID=A0ABQ9HVK5_9NEOP|nr:hypothetical protein PR048_007601 [Dryococelus australis]
MQGDMHRGKEGLGSHGLHFGAMTTSLSVLRASLNYEEQRKNRQERPFASEQQCYKGAVVAERLDCSPPTKAKRVKPPAGSHSEFSQVGIMPDDAAGRRGFLGNLTLPPPSHSGAAPFSPHSSPLALRTSLLRAAKISQLITLQCAVQKSVLRPNTKCSGKFISSPDEFASYSPLVSSHVKTNTLGEFYGNSLKSFPRKSVELSQLSRVCGRAPWEGKHASFRSSELPSLAVFRPRRRVRGRGTCKARPKGGHVCLWRLSGGPYQVPSAPAETVPPLSLFSRRCLTRPACVREIIIHLPAHPQSNYRLFTINRIHTKLVKVPYSEPSFRLPSNKIIGSPLEIPQRDLNTTERGGAVVTHWTRIREDPGSIPGPAIPVWFFRNRSRRILGWVPNEGHERFLTHSLLPVQLAPSLMTSPSTRLVSWEMSKERFAVVGKAGKKYKSLPGLYKERAALEIGMVCAKSKARVKSEEGITSKRDLPRLENGSTSLGVQGRRMPSHRLRCPIDFHACSSREWTVSWTHILILPRQIVQLVETFAISAMGKWFIKQRAALFSGRAGSQGAWETGDCREDPAASGHCTTCLSHCNQVVGVVYRRGQPFNRDEFHWLNASKRLWLQKLASREAPHLKSKGVVGAAVQEARAEVNAWCRIGWMQRLHPMEVVRMYCSCCSCRTSQTMLGATPIARAVVNCVETPADLLCWQGMPFTCPAGAELREGKLGYKFLSSDSWQSGDEALARDCSVCVCKATRLSPNERHSATIQYLIPTAHATHFHSLIPSHLRLKICANLSAVTRVIDCMPVQCSARRGDERFDAHVSLAPSALALLGLRRAKFLQPGGHLKAQPHSTHRMEIIMVFLYS